MVGLGGPGSAATTDEESQPAAMSAPTSTDPSAVLENAEAALAGDPLETPQTVPAPGDELAPVESPSVALAELASVYEDLTASEQRQADALLARPDHSGVEYSDEVFWEDGAPTDVECTLHVCVHFVTDRDSPDFATRDWAVKTAIRMESVWEYEVTSLGYRAPAPDAMGGDSRLDVYLAQLWEFGYYGYCAPDSPGRLQSSGFCVLEDDYSEFVRSPEDNLEVTAAHEFFHAIQYNYDVTEDKWLMEATATWMEERYADSVNDNRQYLKYGQLGKPGVPLDRFGGLTHYGNWLFFEKFSQKYGVDAVQSLWNRLDASPGARNQSSVQAIRRFLEARGTSLRKFYAWFAAGNLAPGRAYSEGNQYRATTFFDTFKLSQRRREVALQLAELRHLTSKSYRFKAGPSLHGKWKLRIRVDGPAKRTDPGAVACVYFKSGKLTKKFIRLNKSGVGSTRVKFNPAKIRRVTLSLVNASSRANASKFTFRAKVVS